MLSPTVERIDMVDLYRHIAGPGDPALFVSIRAAGAVGWYGPVDAACRPHIDDLAGLLEDQPVEAPPLAGRLAVRLASASTAAASWAVGALDCALWDLRGKLAGKPVAELLANDLPAPVVPAYASRLTLDLADPASNTEIQNTAGAPWLFTKWGLRFPHNSCRSVDDWARTIRMAAGYAGGRIALDGLRTWTAEVARALSAAIGPEVLIWLEDPLPHHRGGHPTLGPMGTRLATGEGLLVHHNPRHLVTAGHPDILTIDVVGCGGLSRALEIVRLARKHRTPIYPHGRSLIPGIHLSAAFPDIVHAVEYQLQWQPRRDVLYAEPVQPCNGALRLPEHPGLGLTPRSY